MAGRVLRRNLCTNPQVSSTWGWTPASGASVSVGSGSDRWGRVERQGLSYGNLTTTAQVSTTGVSHTIEGFTAGGYLAVSLAYRTAPGVRLGLQVSWGDVDARPNLTPPGPLIQVSSPLGDRSTWLFHAPEDTHSASLTLHVSPEDGDTLPVGWVASFAEVLAVTGETVEGALADAQSYFDGSTPAARVGSTSHTRSYGWGGAVGRSVSVERADQVPTSRFAAYVEDGDAPRVQVRIPASLVPNGAYAHVVGRADGFEWVPRGGAWEGDGGQRLIADAMAPVNVPIWYELTVGETVRSTERIVRPYQGESLLSDAGSGQQRVNVLWTGEDARELKPRVTEHEIPGRETPVFVYAPTVGAGTMSVNLRTSITQTPLMRALMATPTPVALFHNPRHCFQCASGVCDVPLVTVLAVTGVSHSRASRVDEAERVWQVKGTVSSLPQPGTLLSLSTWDDYDRVGLTWDDLDLRSMTWDAFDATMWKEEVR